MGKLNEQIALITGGNSAIGGVKVSTNPQSVIQSEVVLVTEESPGYLKCQVLESADELDG